MSKQRPERRRALRNCRTGALPALPAWVKVVTDLPALACRETMCTGRQQTFATRRETIKRLCTEIIRFSRN
ncbi:hypothetical protein BLAT2472_40354 [Burkholderia latens]